MMVERASIREMFGAVAPGYDRANQVLSLGVHHYWRRRAVRESGAGPGEWVLDCATGTGDLALAFRRAVTATGRVVGLDFAGPMLTLAVAKAARARATVDFVLGDVLRLPFSDGTFDIASIAFGIRNLDDPIGGLAEMARVVRPGGRVVVLEFGQPEARLFGRAYRWYSQVAIPRVGGWITGKPSSYRYLSESAAAFPSDNRFAELMRQTGAFRSIRVIPVTLRIAYIYVGAVA
ncbi:MAG: bifunctional demethylmenaquinone methyltransferase/2-methoxy-6-polyprenyl-1,4-benzoquinol methylase UbiE [Candidatus Zixiibacteriota bacterium]